MRKALGLLQRYPWAILIAAVLAIVMIPAYLINRMMAATPTMTEAQVSAASPGAKIEATLEVTATPSDDLFQGTLLERQSDGSYQHTRRTLSVRWRPDTSVVMGKKSDVHRGAVIQVNDKSRADGGVDAEKIVILSGYVTVK